ncbi:PREDICTED: uncharacterized protein LOC104818375 [Tarenaya hassleriana]|uniref:uncharacterized protein LOC104818375 n=1 Tax=Tarenaya hassleriana TaxID=28532 RepID=UPI00053C36B1|nr:PREDICTED: uncharacterized protein LOC104818375 [Tarenaya hassleriana]
MSMASLPPTTAPSSTTTSWARTITTRPPAKLRLVSFTKRRASSSSSSITDFDLYDLLGVHQNSDQSQIKAAYRNLQKRCHPDIAGISGHDMAIILNEAYSLLSDPVSRHAYDKEQAKVAELKGYTGRPVYSVWCGSETEHRAVFVDEVKCVGCLKCALCADKTFAIETTYGRARVVSQWADPEYKIQQAIEACPIDCISVVERSDLASLEFLMSKQPRGNVRVGAGNNVGTRVSNIFVDVKKFQARYAEAVSRTTRPNSPETDLRNEARINAVEAIRSISSWLYWQSPDSKPTDSASQLSLTLSRRGKSVDPDIQKLQDAAAARKRARQNGIINRKASLHMHRDEYWIPSARALPSSESSCLTASSFTKPSPVNQSKGSTEDHHIKKQTRKQNPVLQKIPIAVALIAVFMVQYQANNGVSELKEHIGGSWALSIVNSHWRQILSAGFFWYFVGEMVAELVEAAWNKQKDPEE